jgi:hypothetical protein
MRRNIILPVQQVFTGVRERQGPQLDELLAVAAGTGNFVSQFKPLAMGSNDPRALMVKDQDYATPSDHYFGYINKHQKISEA